MFNILTLKKCIDYIGLEAKIKAYLDSYFGVKNVFTCIIRSA